MFNKEKWYLVALCLTLCGCLQGKGEETVAGPGDTPPNAADTEVSVMSFNLKNAQSDTELWAQRKLAVIDLITSTKPDVIGVQEADEAWVEYLQTSLTDYRYYGVGREDGNLQGEATAILYKDAKLNLLSSNTLWLSQTPDIPSVGWDASTFRTASYVVLEDKYTERSFRVLNTHLDHIGANARENGTNVILAQIAQSSEPAIAMGDFNFLERSRQYERVLNSGLVDAKQRAELLDAHSTLNWFIANFDSGYTIDFIFVQPQNFVVKSYRVLSDETVESGTNTMPISDHYPVLVELVLR